MPLVPVTGKLAPSSNPYAFRTASARSERLIRNDGSVIDLFRVTYDAIWLGRKNGVTTLERESREVFSLAGESDMRGARHWFLTYRETTSSVVSPTVAQKYPPLQSFLLRPQ